ncbi:MAG: tRNA 4-thiouridine(8) synthase ThiI [Candidatus Aenigmarchaeota archaeon]|nr:tRNA 4-thiouridine(8) synthase ThiI [Candidatus Aenigmarchaeota archaeon]
MVNTKALILLSGGLDSRLACKILEEQLGKENIEAMFFVLPFGGGCCSDRFCVTRFAQRHGITLNIVDCTKGRLFKEYINILRKPKFSRGTALNPCIDCHLFMLKKAKKHLKGNQVIVTGEVLGERPLSQNKGALSLIEREAGVEVLRPLSAKLLPETSAEKDGLIDREKLFDIRGRQRKNQIALAKKYKIDYPHPAGGCLLCEREYCKKLKQVLNKKTLVYNDIRLLSIGRHFEKSQIILGKNKKENDMLETEKGIKIIPKQPGPTALVRHDLEKNKENLIKKAELLIQRYSKHTIKNFIKNV